MPREPKAYLNAVRAGITSIEHGIFMSEACIQEMIEAGVYLVPTIAAVRNIVENSDSGIPAFVVEKAHRVAEAHKCSIRTFYEAGGLIAMGTDAGTPFNLHGQNAAELAFMVDWGVAPIDALVSATSRGAGLMGIEEEGVIAEGNSADMLIVKGDPTVDIAAVSRRENHIAVYKRGVCVSHQ